MPDGTEPSLFDAPPVETHSVDVAEETILRAWGHTSHNGVPKPPTWRRVRRVTVEVVVERWCAGCRSYLPAAVFGAGKRCPPCRRAEPVAPERRERMKWRAHGRRAKALGFEDCVTFEQWLAVIATTEGRCAAPGCFGHYEKMDHIVSHAAGGHHSPDNLQPLCGEHHRHKTRAERSVSAAGMWTEAS